MFCENCGKQIEDGSTFCEHCGAKCESAPASAPEAATPAAPKAPPAFLLKLKATVAAINKKGKWILPVCGAALVAIIVAIILLVGAGNTVSMRDYLKIEVTGYEGYAEFNCRLDESSLLARALGCKDCKGYGDFDKLSDEVKESYYTKSQNNPNAYTFYSSLDYEYELPEGKDERDLQNGDVITITLTCNEDAAKQMGITLKCGTFQYTVSGLKAAESFDLLQYFDVVYEGTDGYAYAEVRCNTTDSIKVGNITFELEEDLDYFTVRYEDEDDYSWSDTFWPYIDSNNNGELSNGDVITLALNIYNPENFAQYGVALSATEKEVTVAGLTEPEEFDILQYIEFVYSGVNGNAWLSLEDTQESVEYGDFRFDFNSNDIYYQDEYLTSFYFYTDNSSWLSNGDKVMVEVSAHHETLANKGLKFKDVTKEYTVSGLPEYVTELSQLEGILDSFKESAVESITNQLYNNWEYMVHGSYWGDYSNQVIGEDMALYKTILTTSKATNSEEDNKLWLIYSVTLDDNELAAPTVYYFAAMQGSIAYSAESNQLADEIALSIFRGYTSYDELYEDLIESFNLNIEVTP